MLLGACLPKSFWGEAVNITVYLINRCPSSALESRTLMAIWSGIPTNFSNWRVFGALAFAHVKQDKLKAQVVKCTFIGYTDGVKGYKL